MGWIGAIIVGGFAGWIASKMMKADTGIFLNIFIGIVGSILANAILGFIGFVSTGGLLPSLIAGIGGAALLIAGYRAIKK
ncbi:MAG: GlsB/YeaQ/YmgE family stress response membrane protein [Rhodobacteraceae bacterium]|nr:GlsB/YeaQ/YmgE family stress response membrane protein [Paracoccaceae bacterium]